ncbi:hypothetical protein N0V83_000578 [Neocucurbitaria cava]|uniref:Uncharacterized protein n=1 Tax=Neocucurbitaria cava TaxID=798079 RepID=A0A9W8YHR4_9PLEO|nr:hypothetical protein N0V83_000578 [Neocucurbitaria cava]
MPKTLAALPSSQYATLFDVVLGKLLDLVSPLVAAPATVALPAPAPSTVALVRSGRVDFHLTDCKTEGWRAAGRGAEIAGRTGELRHGLHTNNLLESRGAAVRSWGKAWNIEAMAAARWTRKARRRPSTTRWYFFGGSRNA